MGVSGVSAGAPVVGGAPSMLNWFWKVTESVPLVVVAETRHVWGLSAGLSGVSPGSVHDGECVVALARMSPEAFCHLDLVHLGAGHRGPGQGRDGDVLAA